MGKLIEFQNQEQRNFKKELLKNIKMVKRNDGTLKPENTITNCEYILKNEPLLKNRLKFNEFTNVIEVVKPFPWHEQDNFKIKPIDDTEVTYLRKYFEKYDMKNVAPHLNDAIRTVAHDNKYHPIKNYLESLTWDKTQRIDTLLHKLFKTEDNIYYSEVLKIFLVGAVKRIYERGCKFDYMIIIVGEQGIRKSTFFKLLAITPEWYLEDLRSIDKAGIEQIQGKWIIEWAELTAMKRAREANAIKNFITTTHDTVRLPYDRYASTLERQGVFCGTTNDNVFLQDKTGNRRFLPILANIPQGEFIDTDSLSPAIINQLWAEAVELYKSGYTPILSPEANNIAVELQNYAMEEDVYFGLIQQFLEREGFGNQAAPNEVCSQMLWEKALDGRGKVSRKDSNDIIIAMNRIPNWKLYNGSKDGRKKVDGYGYQKCWVRTSIEP